MDESLSERTGTGNEHPMLRVLIVDDERLIRWSIAETLAAAGHRVFEAADAASARERLDHLDPPVDVVLLDYRLPDNDDLSLLAHIRKTHPEAAVVMMTAFGSPEISEAARRLGAHAMIAKPFDVGVVEAALTAAHAGASS